MNPVHDRLHDLAVAGPLPRLKLRGVLLYFEFLLLVSTPDRLQRLATLS